MDYSNANGADPDKPYVCNVPDSEKPMVFKGYPYCSENCRKRFHDKEEDAN